MPLSRQARSAIEAIRHDAAEALQRRRPRSSRPAKLVAVDHISTVSNESSSGMETPCSLLPGRSVGRDDVAGSWNDHTSIARASSRCADVLQLVPPTLTLV